MMGSGSRRTVHPRHGFTLVEMLVAVGLVLLMMSMFAAIFQMAAGSVTTTRGLAKNDQRTRSFAIVLRADLDKRTQRNLVPFVPNEDSVTSPTPFGNRRGYFYLSVNDPVDFHDDVLQFTVDTNIILRNRDDTVLFGRGEQVFDAPGNIPTNFQDAMNELVANPNQPEADDAQVEPNGVASSSAAEVSYFIRNGNLYRRVLLIREPLPLAGLDTEPQPEREDGSDPFDLDMNPAGENYVTSQGATNNFWRDFDFAAFRRYDPMDPDTPLTNALFHGLDSLNNDTSGSTFFALGKPMFRFGHNTSTGMPREHTSLASPGFIGRFLHEETSHDRFNYPQGACQTGNGNPMDVVNTPLTFTADGRRVVAEFSGGTRVGLRRAEDLLLANVHEFRVELWDQRLQRFVPPAHAQFTPGPDNDISTTGDNVAGDLHASRRYNPAYGPFGGAAANRVFDTWHPAADLDSDGVNDAPPFRPMDFYPPGGTVAPVGIFWDPGTTYAVGDVVFPRTEDLNGNGILDGGEDGSGPFNADGNFETEAPSRPFGYAYHYRCVQAGESGAAAPQWQGRRGALISEDAASAPDGISGGAGDVIWEAVPNLRPIQAVRITVRFFDISTDQMRQVTIIHSLLD